MDENLIWCQFVKEKCDQRKKKRSNQSREKADNLKSRYKITDQPKKENINEDGRNTKSQNWNRQGDQLENGFDKGIDNANDNCSHNRRPKTFKNKAGNKILNNKKSKNICGQSY